jgi:hypothetical protein
MKKFYSFGLMLAIAGSMSAQSQIKHSPGNSPSAKYNPYKDEVIQQVLSQKTKHPMIPGAAKSASTEEELGVSVYDLQSNGSICPRIVADDNGVAATFTFSALEGGGTYTDRGTGYNFRNPSTNQWDDFPSSRIETMRTGWSNLMHLANGSEMVIAHSGTGGVKMTSRSAVGTGTWNTTSEIPTNTGEAMLWPRACNVGNTIHMIAITDPNDATPYNGLESCLLYYRSQDGGATWDVVDGNLPEVNSDFISSVTADTYAIHARGNTVAIAVFGELQDTYVLVSEDGGTTWTKTVVWDFPIDNYVVDMGTDIEGDGIQDTIMSTEGTGAIYVDANNVLHVAFGTMFYTDDLGVVDSVYSYFPLAGSIAYWNSGMTPTVTGVDSVLVGQDSTFLYNEIVYSNEIDLVNSTYVMSDYSDPYDMGSGPIMIGTVAGAPASISWTTAELNFDDVNLAGAILNINGNSSLLPTSGVIDISQWGLGSSFDYTISSAIDSILTNVNITFNGTYNTGEILDTVFVIASITPVYSYTDVYNYVDVLSYNDVVLQIGVSPDNDATIPASGTEVGQYGNSGIASHPQLAGDANGNVYCTYSAINENFFNGQEYLRHVWAVKSADGGATWSTEVDITPDLAGTGWEYMYASLAHEMYNDRLHLVIQKDEEPGIHVQPETVADPVADNLQIYLAVTSDLVATFNESVSDVEAIQTMSVYPNPSSNAVNVITENWMGGQLQVIDLTGRQVVNQKITAGRTILNVSEWNAGLYQVVVLNNGQKVVSTLVVE